VQLGRDTVCVNCFCTCLTSNTVPYLWFVPLLRGDCFTCSYYLSCPRVLLFYKKFATYHYTVPSFGFIVERGWLYYNSFGYLSCPWILLLYKSLLRIIAVACKLFHCWEGLGLLVSDPYLFLEYWFSQVRKSLFLPYLLNCSIVEWGWGFTCFEIFIFPPFALFDRSSQLIITYFHFGNFESFHCRERGGVCTNWEPKFPKFQSRISALKW